MSFSPKNVLDVAIPSPNARSIVITMSDHTTAILMGEHWAILSKLHSKS